MEKGDLSLGLGSTGFFLALAFSSKDEGDIFQRKASS
jgi:hypothetical protein